MVADLVRQTGETRIRLLEQWDCMADKSREGLACVPGNEL